MVRSKQGKNGKGKGKVQTRAPARVVATRMPRRIGYSPDVASYKRILVDPCNAPLPKSPYGVTGNSVYRNVGWTTTHNAYHVFAFHPVYGLFSTGALNGTTAITFNPDGALSANTAGARAIAGCLNTTWINSESTRQGSVFCGVVPGGWLWNSLATASGGNNSAFTINQLANLMSNFERTPVDKCEVNWFPGDGEDEPVPPSGIFTSTNVTAVQGLLSKTNFAVVLLYNSVPNSNQIGGVGVVEQINSTVTAAYGVVTVSSELKAPFDWREVVTSLGRQDPNWFIGAFRKIGSLVGGMAKSYSTMGLPGALGYLTSEIAGVVYPRQRVKSG